MKLILVITVSVIIILSVTACQSGPNNPPAATVGITEPSPSMPTAEAFRPTIPACFTPIDLNPISFTPDNTKLVIGARSGVQIFNLEMMKEEKFFKASSSVQQAALSPNGQTLAWLLEEHTIQLIQTSNGKILQTRKLDNVDDLKFSPLGNKLFLVSNVGSVDGLVHIWDIAKTEDEMPVISTNREVLEIAISPDGTTLATVPFDGPVELWDLTTHQKITEVGGTGGDDMSTAIFSPDGKYLAVNLPTGMFVWRISDKKLLWESPKNGLTVTFSPDGRFLAYAEMGTQHTVTLTSSDGTQTIHIWKGMQWAVWGLTFSPDNSMLAAVVDTSEIRIWRVDDGKLLYVGKESCP